MSSYSDDANSRVGRVMCISFFMIMTSIIKKYVDFPYPIGAQNTGTFLSLFIL